MQLNSIKFPCKWRDDYGKPRHGLAEFKLGPGPCGKDVTNLKIESDDVHMTIEQRCSDGTTKVFVYKVSDVTGRVEMEYA